MKKIISSIVTESIEVKERSISNALAALEKTAKALASCLESGHRVLIFGNGEARQTPSTWPLNL